MRVSETTTGGVDEEYVFGIERVREWFQRREVVGREERDVDFLGLNLSDTLANTLVDFLEGFRSRFTPSLLLDECLDKPPETSVI